jgi:hypothetical protein
MLVHIGAAKVALHGHPILLAKWGGFEMQLNIL